MRASNVRPSVVCAVCPAGGIDYQSFTADIILDEIPPTVQSAQLVGGRTASAVSTASVKAKAHSYRIKIKAKDKIVGICAVAASAKKSGGTVVTVGNCHVEGIHSLAKTVTIKSTTRPKYVRAWSQFSLRINLPIASPSLAVSVATVSVLT
jgi:hypothetical protein